MTTAEKPAGSFLRELKRRKVLKTSLYYILVCWVALQVAGFVLPVIGLDDLWLRALVIIAIVGFPINVMLAWYFQLTPSGIARTTNFVERRVLRNMAPINDRRHSRVASDPNRDAVDKTEYRWLISAETGPLTGLSFGINSPVELGRSLDCDIAIVSPHVSPRHARLSLDDDALVVEDLGSANGTVVNGKPIEGRHRLHHEDEVRLHDVIFRVTER